MARSDHDNEESPPSTESDEPDGGKKAGWRRYALGWGAVAAIASAVLAIAANLSEIAGIFAPDETREIVEQTRVAITDTDEKVEELLVLLRNQAAATGLDLNIESESAIRNAVSAIIASSNAQKQVALRHLNDGDIDGAADLMAKVAGNQAGAVSETSDAAADTWQEAGALYFTVDMPQAVASFREADRLRPRHVPTLDMLGYALVRAGELDEAEGVFHEILELEASPVQAASASAGLGNIAKQRGEYRIAEQHLQAALDATREHRTSAEHIGALISFGQLELARGRIPDAIATLRSALPYAEEAGNERMRAKALTALGTVAARQERFDEAEYQMQQALDFYERENDLAGRVNTLGNLGAVSLSRGDLESAERRIAESAELSERLGWQSSLAYDLVNLAAIASQKGEFELADERLSRAQAISADVGLRELLPIIIFNRGEAARDAGDGTTACEHWLTALPMLVEMGSIHVEHARSEIEKAGC